MSNDSYKLKEIKSGKEDINDVYDTNKIKIKKINCLILCIVLILFLAGVIVGTYFITKELLPCPKETENETKNKCREYVCQRPDSADGKLNLF